jgi:hypothetical protein
MVVNDSADIVSTLARRDHIEIFGTGKGFAAVMSPPSRLATLMIRTTNVWNLHIRFRMARILGRNRFLEYRSNSPA